MYFIFNEPTFASVGHAHPDKRGKAHSSLKGKVLFATSYKYVVKDGRKQPTYKGFFSTFGIDGNILQASVFDETGQLDEITTYKYNNAGCIEECQTIKASGAQVSRFIFKYNREHLLCSSEWRSEDDEYCGTHYYIYDSKGNLIDTPKAYNPKLLQISARTFFICHKELKIPNIKSVERVRRKIQEKCPELASERAKRKRAEEKEAYITYSKT